MVTSTQYDRIISLVCCGRVLLVMPPFRDCNEEILEKCTHCLCNFFLFCVALCCRSQKLLTISKGSETKIKLPTASLSGLYVHGWVPAKGYTLK